jgi:hypothetical protein
MKRLITFSVLFIFGIISVETGPLSAPALAEIFVGSNADNRVTVALRVGQEAVQSWLPTPWQSEPVTAGPFKGANLIVLFIDRLFNQDSAGKPAAGGTFRLAALKAPAKHSQTGESASFVLKVYGPHEGPGPYKNSFKAMVRREAALNVADLEPGTGSELWEVRDSEGGILKFRMDYQRALPVRTKGEDRPHSNIDPNFFRMYRYDQLLDVVKSIPDSIDRVQNYQLRVTMSELSGLFNGTEKLVGITISPWYGRQTFLP